METMSMFAKKEDLYKAKSNRLEQENAALLEFIQDLCNEFMDIDGEQGKFIGSSLSEKANKFLGI